MDSSHWHAVVPSVTKWLKIKGSLVISTVPIPLTVPSMSWKRRTATRTCGSINVSMQLTVRSAPIPFPYRFKNTFTNNKLPWNLHYSCSKANIHTATNCSDRKTKKPHQIAVLSGWTIGCGSPFLRYTMKYLFNHEMKTLSTIKFKWHLAAVVYSLKLPKILVCHPGLECIEGIRL